jgi:DNA-binding GntR family transcriptional regulator
MIEPNVARLAAERATEEDLKTLERHLRLEHEAHHNGKRRDAIRLSGQFHVLLAEIAGNTVALRMVKELVTRTSLIIGIFGSPGVSNCRDDDHDEIFGAFRTAQGELASRLMADHLRHIEQHLELSGPAEGASDLVAIFRK